MANKEVRFSAQQQDKAGNKAAVTSYLWVPEASTITQVNTAFAAWYAAVAAVSDANTVTGHWSSLPQPAQVNGVGFDDSWLGNSAVLNFKQNGTTAGYGMAIPAIIDAAVTSGNIDIANANIAALVALLTGAVLGGVYTDNSYNTGGLASLNDAFRASRKHNSNRRKVFA